MSTVRTFGFLMIVTSTLLLISAALAEHAIVPGLKVDGDTPETAYQLASQVRKCRSDSFAFLKLLGRVQERTRALGSTPTNSVRLSASRTTDSMIGHAGAKLGEMYVDLSDLGVLPNPITNGKRDEFYKPLFDPISGVPAWATTVCGWLGHEIAEMLEDVVAGGRNRKKHHYEIANVVEDDIAKDYFQSDRRRGEDCTRPHSDHIDYIIQIDPYGLEILHQSRPAIEFSNDGTTRLRTEHNRLGYIEYRSNEKFPGRAAGTADCR